MLLGNGEAACCTSSNRGFGGAWLTAKVPRISQITGGHSRPCRSLPRRHSPLQQLQLRAPPKEPGAFSSVGSTSQGGLLVNLQSYFSYVLQIEATLACNFQ